MRLDVSLAPMKQRVDQIASVIRRAVGSELSRGLHDRRVKGLISVTDVTVGKDLAEATVHVSVLPAEHAQLTLHGLQHAAPRLRARLGKSLSLRRIPRLRFRLDDSLKRQAEFDRALGEVRRFDGHAAGDLETEGEGP